MNDRPDAAGRLDDSVNGLVEHPGTLGAAQDPQHGCRDLDFVVTPCHFTKGTTVEAGDLAAERITDQL